MAQSCQNPGPISLLIPVSDWLPTMHPVTQDSRREEVLKASLWKEKRY